MPKRAFDLAKKSKEFIEANPPIEEALRLFQITEEQYKKALQSLQRKVVASDTANVTVQSEAPWTNK